MTELEMSHSEHTGPDGRELDKLSFMLLRTFEDFGSQENARF